MGAWLWFGGLVLGIVALFAFLLWQGGAEPLDRKDTADVADGHEASHHPGDGHGHP
jgi:hypothetical protein